MPKTSAPPLSLDPDRSLTLETMLGCGPISRYLSEAVENGRLPAALLIDGPRGVGKKTLAWSLAKQIVAEGEDVASHRGVAKIERETHPDTRACYPSSASGQILIDDVREIEDWMATAPLESPKKIAIISPAERMNVHAANCLLKILEEPPSHAQFVLTAGDASRLLPTIRSRCSSITLEPVPSGELAQWIERKTGSSPERAELTARLAEGRPGYALSILASKALEQRAEILEELSLLQVHGFAVVFRVADRMAALNSDLATTLGTALLLLRDALAAAMGLDHLLNRDLEARLLQFGEASSSEGLLEAAELLDSAIEGVAGYYTPQARAHYLEVLFTRIGRLLRRA